MRNPGSYASTQDERYTSPNKNALSVLSVSGHSKHLWVISIRNLWLRYQCTQNRSIKIRLPTHNCKSKQEVMEAPVENNLSEYDKYRANSNQSSISERDSRSYLVIFLTISAISICSKETNSEWPLADTYICA